MVQIYVKSKTQSKCVPRDTKKSKFLDLVDSGVATFSVETIIQSHVRLTESNSYWDCDLIWICTEEFEFLELMDFGQGGIFSGNCHTESRESYRVMSQSHVTESCESCSRDMTSTWPIMSRTCMSDCKMWMRHFTYMYEWLRQSSIYKCAENMALCVFTCIIRHTSLAGVSHMKEAWHDVNE